MTTMPPIKTLRRLQTHREGHMQKRELLTAALGLGVAGLAASRTVPALAAQAAAIPVRRVKTTLLWKVDGFPNAMDTTPDGIWVGEQTQNGFNGGTKGERAWLFDPATGRAKQQIV